MGAMTRNRAGESGVPNDLMVKFYSQRTKDPSIILTECMAISAEGSSFLNGNCFNDEQIKGWRKVTDAVHKDGGIIFAQIYHCGRATKITGLAPSVIRNRHQESFAEPKEMSLEDIEKVKKEFFTAAKLLKEEGGFDGIEIHSANGYLIDLFLRDATNNRTDKYGGSYENRSRFLLEVLDGVVSIWGADRVAIKLSPIGRYNDMFDSNPKALLEYLIPEVDKRKIAFVELMVNDTIGKINHYGVEPLDQLPDAAALVRPLLKNVKLVANSGLGDLAKANEYLEKDKADLISIATLYISNPDLLYRFKNGVELTQPKYNLLFTPGEEGYTDYEFVQKK